MAGHNKWSQIKHKKAITDIKRSQKFTKLLTAIQVAVKTEEDVSFNTQLKTAIVNAKRGGVPQENIDRAVNKSKKCLIDSLIIEAHDLTGVAMIIKALTDNRNRTMAEIKKLLTDNDIKFASPGSAMWMFTKNKEEGFDPQFLQEISNQELAIIHSKMDSLLKHPDIIDIYINVKK